MIGMNLLLRTTLLLRLCDVMRVDACERHSEYSRVVPGLVVPRSVALSFGARSAPGDDASIKPPGLAKMDHSMCKSALLQEIQLYAYVAGQDPLAAARIIGTTSR